MSSKSIRDMSPPQVGMGRRWKWRRALSRRSVIHSRLALHPGHLPDDVLGEAPLGLEDVVVLDVAPAQLVAVKIEFGCRHGRHTPWRNYSYADSNNFLPLSHPSDSMLAAQPGEDQPSGSRPAAR